MRAWLLWGSFHSSSSSSSSPSTLSFPADSIRALLVGLLAGLALAAGAQLHPLSAKRDPWEQLRDRHLQQRCLYVGNGPSLNQTPWAALLPRFDVVMGVNKIFLGFERFGLLPNYYAAANALVLEQARADILAMPRGVVKFVRADRWHGSARERRDHNIVLFHSVSRCEPDGSRCTAPGGERPELCARCADCFCGAGAADTAVVEGNTVTYVALQLLHFLGCRTVVLVGVDHRFQQRGRANEAQVMAGPDPNHFDARYFSGQAWQLADLAASERHYRLAGRQMRVVDATLTVFHRPDHLSEVLHPRTTVFSVPKPWRGRDAETQALAVRSWLALDPRPRVLLCAAPPDAASVRAAAAALGAEFCGGLRANEFGVPLLDGAFRAALATDADVLLYVNADIVLAHNTTAALAALAAEPHAAALYLGRRFEVDARSVPADGVVRADGPRPAPGRFGGQSYLDYFAFTRAAAPRMPPMAAGRAFFDWLLVAQALERGAVVRDVTASVGAYHINHAYGHIQKAYGVRRRNQSPDTLTNIALWARDLGVEPPARREEAWGFFKGLFAGGNPFQALQFSDLRRRRRPVLLSIPSSGPTRAGPRPSSSPLDGSRLTLAHSGGLGDARRLVGRETLEGRRAGDCLASSWCAAEARFGDGRVELLRAPLALEATTEDVETWVKGADVPHSQDVVRTWGAPVPHSLEADAVAVLVGADGVPLGAAWPASLGARVSGADGLWAVVNEGRARGLPVLLAAAPPASPPWALLWGGVLAVACGVGLLAL